MKVIGSKIGVALGTALLLSSVASYAASADDRYVYIGAELGVSEPVVKKFIDKDTNANFRLKQSGMFGGRVGYGFYPGMMIEISGTYQPKYGFTYLLPTKEVDLTALGGPKITIPRTPGRTKVISNVYTLNLIYEMNEQFAGIKPYAIFGAGFARITMKPTTAKTNALAGFGLGEDFEYFRLKKHTGNYFAWQIGAGLAKNIAENFMVDFGVKLQVVNDIKVKYDTYDVGTRSFVEQKPIKKSIGVGEITLGFTYKFPVK